MTPEWLPGNVGGAVRIGGTVHRPTGPWTPAVHALLAYLGERLPLVPAVYGFDLDGREVLAYAEGKVEEVVNDAQLTGLVSWTRRFHEVVVGFAHPGPWRYFPIPGATFIGHNDLAAYNVCFDGDRLAGVFDWDLAGPTNALQELAFIAWNGVPMWADLPREEAARRLRLIADTYGGPGAQEILDAVVPRIELMIAGIADRAAAGDPGMRNLVAHGEQERDRATLAWLRPRIPGIAAALSP
ncbi:phosphotransferase [Hamadaea tsunoensis]|uniref:phosphotransferase n=1 Tax=Hamadaea tsunoensis TaxID=53368 RepID=UPI000405C089|nr:phosphotransferase [Hamadaea tsunoensis]